MNSHRLVLPVNEHALSHAPIFFGKGCMPFPGGVAAPGGF